MVTPCDHLASLKRPTHGYVSALPASHQQHIFRPILSVLTTNTFEKLLTFVHKVSIQQRTATYLILFMGHKICHRWQGSTLSGESTFDLCNLCVFHKLVPKPQRLCDRRPCCVHASTCSSYTHGSGYSNPEKRFRTPRHPPSMCNGMVSSPAAVQWHVTQRLCGRSKDVNIVHKAHSLVLIEVESSISSFSQIRISVYLYGFVGRNTEV